MKYAKGLLALVLAFGTVLVTALGTSPQQNLSHLGWQDWLKVILAFLGTGAFTAWVTNIPGTAGGVIKAFAAGVGTFCTALITAYADQIITQGELIGAVVAAVTAGLAIYQTPNVVTVAGRRLNWSYRPAKIEAPVVED